jgi:hypothetical protein
MAIAKVSCIIGAPDAQNVGEAPAKLASVALVSVVAAPWRLAPVAQGLARPDPCFVIHLIAMAELSPQTRLLRRAAAEDVQAAYRSVATQNRTVTPPGVRMRQIA